MRAHRIALAAVGLLLGSWSMHACTSARRPTAGQAPAETQATGHWVQDAQLRKIMDEVQSLATTTWPQELEPEVSKSNLQQRLRAFAEAERLAEGLAQAADSIPQAVADVKISEADRGSFLASVQTLREQARRLGEAAQAGDDRRMEGVLNAIDETCMSCHERFRDFSGPINRG
jgi:cytochrome c556